MAIDNNFRAFRIRDGLTQPEVARALGIGRMAVQKIESGKCFVRASTLQAACALFHCTPGDLFPTAADRVSAETRETVQVG